MAASKASAEISGPVRREHAGVCVLLFGSRAVDSFSCRISPSAALREKKALKGSFI